MFLGSDSSGGSWPKPARHMRPGSSVRVISPVSDALVGWF